METKKVWSKSDIDLYLSKIEKLQGEVEEYWNSKNIFKKIFGWKHMVECHKTSGIMIEALCCGIGLPRKKGQ